MTTTDSAPSVVLEPTTLGDLELVLHGVLPSGHTLGGPVSGPVSNGMPSAPLRRSGPPIARVPVPESTAEAAVAASGLTLTDHELTPLATLDQPAVTGHDGPAVEVSGSLRQQRSRESGEGRLLALTEADRSAGFARVVVLARPVLTGIDDLVEPDGRTLLVVPDDPHSTDGVPTSVMLEIAKRWAATMPDAEVRTAPLRWRSPDSDRALTLLLADFLATSECLILHADPDVDVKGGAAWRTVRHRLDEATASGIPLDELTEPDADALRRWRPPRPRRGLVVMFTGLSGSGKSTLARSLKEHIVRTSERTVTLLDGDIVRQLLSSGLGFDRDSRILNIRRIGFVAAEVARHGGVAICAPVAPYAATRQEVREMAEAVGDFVLVHVSTPLAECERRDLKGLYAKARAGLVPEFTGISDPYEVPDDADLSIDTTHVTPGEALDMLDGYLRTHGWMGEPQ